MPSEKLPDHILGYVSVRANDGPSVLQYDDISDLERFRASSERHGFDAWEVIAATQTVVLQAIRALRSGTADAAALTEHADDVGANVVLWQIVTPRIEAMMKDPDKSKAKRAMDAMMKMVKIDIAGLEKAFAG